VERWTTLARDGMDIREIQEPEKHQPLCVVVQTPAVSVHEEPLYVSTGQHFRSLSQILSQLPYHRWVKNDVARVAELAVGNTEVRWVRIESYIVHFKSERFADSQATAR
jgi:hypothetical protein